MFLLDTHALLWMFSSPELLGVAAHRVVKDRKNKVYASMTSIWEIGVKISVGKLNMPDGVDFLVEKEIKTSSLILLPIRVSHVSVVSRLPLHHRDPFDRMLVAQAIAEGLSLITSDPAMKRYPVPVVW